MLSRLIAGCLDVWVWWQRRRVPALAWRSLYEAIQPEASEHPIYLEHRNRSFVRVDSSTTPVDDANVVALAVSLWRDGTPIWEMEEPAKELAERLVRKLGVQAFVLIRRDLDSFLGYYVSVRA